MRRVAWLLALALSSGVAAQEARPLAKEPAPRLSKGQALYLPIYSHLLYGNVGRGGAPNKVLLSALVSIRNTDAKRPLQVLSARYYETQGRFLREYVGTPTAVPPLGTLELFVELHDESGGSGANFLIKWAAEAPINPPLVEALHANMDSGKAVIVTTQAVPVAVE